MIQWERIGEWNISGVCSTDRKVLLKSGIVFGKAFLSFNYKCFHNFQECIFCEDNIQSNFYTSYDEEIHDMDLNEMIEESGENNLVSLSQVSEEQT